MGLYPYLKKNKNKCHMAKKYTVLHKKSNVLVNGEPKLPSASTLQYGEIAINYAVGGETLSIKNAADEVVEFTSKNKILSSVESALTEVNNTIESDEEVIAVALNDLGGQIGRIPIIERTSQLINDSAFVTTADTADFITGYTETDPTVSAWAKAASKPSYTAAEVGAMATSERSNYSTTGHTHSQYSLTSHTHSEYSLTSHTHTAAEVGAMATSERNNYLTTATTIPTESTIAGSGFTKNAITGINVNGSAATITNGVANITVQSGGSGLPAVTASDNGKILQVVNGAWALVTPTTVYTGTDVPLSSVGSDGDIYLQTS